MPHPTAVLVQSFKQFPHTWDIGFCEVPCTEPCCLLGSCLCFPCVSHWLFVHCFSTSVYSLFSFPTGQLLDPKRSIKPWSQQLRVFSRILLWNFSVLLSVSVRVWFMLSSRRSSALPARLRDGNTSFSARKIQCSKYVLWKLCHWQRHLLRVFGKFTVTTATALTARDYCCYNCDCCYTYWL